jgi:hypothetical protein
LCTGKPSLYGFRPFLSTSTGGILESIPGFAGGEEGGQHHEEASRVGSRRIVRRGDRGDRRRRGVRPVRTGPPGGEPRGVRAAPASTPGVCAASPARAVRARIAFPRTGAIPNNDSDGLAGYDAGSTFDSGSVPAYRCSPSKAPSEPTVRMTVPRRRGWRP